MMTAMVRKVYPDLDLVTCREAASLELLQNMGITNAELIPDVVFWLGEEAEATRSVDEWLADNDLEPGNVRVHERLRPACEPAQG